MALKQEKSKVHGFFSTEKKQRRALRSSPNTFRKGCLGASCMQKPFKRGWKLGFAAERNGKETMEGTKRQRHVPRRGQDTGPRQHRRPGGPPSLAGGGLALVLGGKSQIPARRCRRLSCAARCLPGRSPFQTDPGAGTPAPRAPNSSPAPTLHRLRFPTAGDKRSGVRATDRLRRVTASTGLARPSERSRGNNPCDFSPTETVIHLSIG